MSEPQETVTPVFPAVAVEAPAATEPEAPIATQVLAADNVCRPPTFAAVFAPSGWEGILTDTPAVR
jgi:hypothetical protein